jgi:hypothetical protein
MGERSRRRVRDLVTQLAFEGLSENEIGRARISMMARSDLLHARAGYRSARPTTVPKIQLATHGRSIQSGQSRRFAPPLTTSESSPNSGHDPSRPSLPKRALISAIMGHAGAAPTSAPSSSKAPTKLPGGPRRGLGLSQIGRQMPALLSFTFLDLKCGSASSRAVRPV